MKPRIIAIAGPTASGKTDLSIHIADKLNTEIISFDSRQFYHELNIGVARPSENQLAAVPHHFIANRSIHDPYTAASFTAEARIKIDAILGKHEYVVLCGGTGLYLKAVLEGFSKLPQIKIGVREEVESIWEKNGLPGLITLIESLDPTAILMVESQNPARMKRAAELLLSAENMTLQDIYTPKMEKIKHPYQIFNLIPERKWIYQRIESRADAMMKAGLLEEVRSLLPWKNLPVLKTVGYSELFDYLDEKTSLEEAINKIKQHTRNYAKRQITWFKNKTEGIVINGEKSIENVVNFL